MKRTRRERNEVLPVRLTEHTWYYPLEDGTVELVHEERAPDGVFCRAHIWQIRNGRVRLIGGTSNPTPKRKAQLRSRSSR